MNMKEVLHYLAILKKRWWLILVLVAATVGTIVFTLLTQEPVYEASIKFLFSTPPVAEVTVYDEFRQPSVRDEIPFAKSNFIEVLTSKVVIWDAINALGANVNADQVSAGLTVEELANSEFVRLAVRQRDPQLAADMTNALMDAALKYYGELRARPTTMSSTFINEQLSLAQETWQKAEDELTRFQLQNQIGDLDTQIATEQSLIRSLILQQSIAVAENDTQGADKYSTIISQREETLQSMVGLRSQYTALKAAANQTRDTYELLLNRQTQAKLKENEILNVGFVSALGPATPPSSPVSTFDLKLVLLGALMSLVVGILLAVGWEYLAVHRAMEKAQESEAVDRDTLPEATS